MLNSPTTRAVYVLSLLAALMVVLGLGLVVMREAFSAGSAEAWMTGLVLLVVVGLPAVMVLLPVAAWLRRRAALRAIVPPAGENVPGAGQ